MLTHTEIYNYYCNLEGASSLRAAVVESFMDEEQYQIRDLTDPQPGGVEGFRNTQASQPYHWFGLYLAPDDRYGLRALQFGIARSAAIRPAQELLMEVTAKNGVNIGSGPYRVFGGLVVDAARSEGHKVFAALEVNSLEISDDEALLFAKLSISKALLKSADIYRESLKKQGRARDNMTGWGKRIQAARPQNYWRVAEVLALSAITCAGISDAAPKTE